MQNIELSKLLQEKLFADFTVFLSRSRILDMGAISIDIAPKLGALSNNITPKREYMWFLVLRYTMSFLVEKSRRGYSPPKWDICEGYGLP